MFEKQQDFKNPQDPATKTTTISSLTSQADRELKEDGSEPRYSLGLRLKRETTHIDVFMLFYLPFMGMAGSGFVNAQMTFLLQSD